MPTVAKKKLKKKSPEDRYVGEKKNQLRHGHGVYRYENTFYRYEGQWKEGFKHGHGKLIMKDGGYYEGTFEHGEIEGHGYKVFGISRATYTGQFHRGEMHGQGLMRRPSGEQYEGCWKEGKRHGLGILTESDGGIYEGYFHENQRHEQGLQIYCNGDQYEGDWVLNKRHGHGMLRCADGTMYDGQWRNGIFHGDGKMCHSSGVIYHGMWLNGRPQYLGVKLRLAEDADVIFVEQGQTFDMHLECVDEEGNVAKLESGRSFKVVASMRKVPRSLSKARSRMLSEGSSVSNSTVIRSKPDTHGSIVTPFGYTTLPYELLQMPAAPESTEQSISQTESIPLSPSKKMVKFDSDESHVEGDIKPSSTMLFDPDTQSSSVMPTTTESETPDKSRLSSRATALSSADKSTPLSTSENKDTPVTITSTDDTPDDSKLHALSSTNLHSASQVVSPPWTRKRSGSVAIHRSPEGSRSVVLSKSNDTEIFGSEEEEFLAGLTEPELIMTKDGTAMIKDLFLPPPPAPDITHIITPSLKSKHSPSISGSRSTTKTPNLRSPSPNPPKSPVPPPKSPGLVTPRQSGAVSSISSIKSGSKKRSAELEKEKLFKPKREKYCAPGSYVMIISEVTSPKYFGHIEDLYVEVTVASHKIGPHSSSIDRLLQANRKSRASITPIPEPGGEKVPRSKSKLLTQNKM